MSESEKQADGSTLAGTTNWTYDADGRLTGETYVSSTNSSRNYADVFSYDLVGNRMTKTHTTGIGSSTSTEAIGYTYNNDDQLQTETATLNSSPEYATSYNYDNNGSLISKTRTGTGAESDTYAYDTQNNLASSTVNGVTTTYATDAAGDRVQETVGSGTTYSLTSDLNPTGYSQVLEQKTSPTGVPTTSYILGDHVLGQANGGNASYLVTDGHGSTRQLTSITGVITATYDYDAFGNVISFTATGAATGILYAGQQFDAGLSEYHLRARDYDPSTGRFTSFDSSEGSNSDPASLHNYLYAGADPINAYDPSGHDLA